MNVHSLSSPMSVTQVEPVLDRPTQILDAAMVCFAKRGFHQTSMHDISAEAGISVGLIYRYFENKEAVISAMADRHKQEINDVLQRARLAPSLLESLEVLFTSHCCEKGTQVTSAFVVDLFAEASRNPRVAELVRDVCETTMDGVTDLIARAPESTSTSHNLTPRQMAELIFAVNDGLLMREVLNLAHTDDQERRERQLNIARNLWRLLFSPQAVPVYA
jgi:TetR/AcrR family transcriptional regulator, repressor for uid operon